MAKMQRIILSVLSLVMAFTLVDIGAAPPVARAEEVQEAVGTTYYVDSDGGSDENPGTAEEEAWKTLDKVNATTFGPGDQILFKRGGVWNGLLWPKGSGSEGAPVIVEAYGEGEQRPIINGGGSSTADFENETGEGSAVFLYNQEYWEINNLEVTNTGDERAHRTGVRILAKDADTVSHIHLKNLYVHDVNGDNINYEWEQEGHSDQFKRSGGIQFNIIGNQVMTKYDDILVDGCTVERVSRTGIQIGVSSWRNRFTYDSGEGEWYPSTNVVVQNCVLNEIGGDGILVRECEGQLVQYNYVNESNHDAEVANVAIWPWNSDNALFQYNEACNTNSTHDGEGFDCDYLCQNTTFQYNYSHNNEGGFMLVCSPSGAQKNVNNVIRYNISENDQERVIKIHGNGTNNTQIYNNVFYLDESVKGKVVEMLSHEEWSGYSRNTYYYNNIFYNLADAAYEFRYSTNTVFENNCFYGGNLPKESSQTTFADSNIVAEENDVIFVDAGPGRREDKIDFNDPNRLSGYKLAADSICINKGKKINENGGKDFWGNPLYSGDPDIGAFEYQDESFVPSPDEEETSAKPQKYELTTADKSDSSDGVSKQEDVVFRDGQGVAFNANAVGDYVEFILDVPEAGTYEVWVAAKNTYNRGKYKAYINDIPIGKEKDGYSNQASYPVESLGTAALQKGKNKIRFEIIGKNSSSSGYALVFDYIDLIRQESGKYECEDLDAESTRERKRTENPNASGGALDSLEYVDAEDNYVTYTVPNVKAGTYRVKVGVRNHNNKGTYELFIDGKKQGDEQDQYRNGEAWDTHDFGTIEFEESGDKKFQFKVTGKNESSEGYTLMFDYISLEPAVGEAMVRLQVEPPDKVEYLLGDKLDLTGMKVSAVYNNGRMEEIKIEDCEITGFDSEEPGEKIITVSYKGVKATFVVKVKADSSETGKYELEDFSDEEVEKSNARKQYDKPKASGGRVDSLECSQKDNYIEYTFPVKAGTYRISVGAVSNFNKGTYQLQINGMNTGGVQDLYSASEEFPVHKLGTVTFDKDGDQKFRFVVTGANSLSKGYSLMLDYILLEPVGEKKLEGIEVIGPDKQEYKIGEELDTTGMKVTVLYSTGEKEDIDIAKCKIEGFDSSVEGVKTITVTFEGMTDSFTVYVRETEAEIWRDYLKATIDAAEAEKDTLPKNLVPEIRTEFTEALSAARELFNDASAADDDMKAANERLITVMHYLTFITDKENPGGDGDDNTGDGDNTGDNGDDNTDSSTDTDAGNDADDTGNNSGSQGNNDQENGFTKTGDTFSVWNIGVFGSFLWRLF